jgi:tellurite resistance-related uncharacterized protein
MNLALPTDAESYKRTVTFTEATVPAALLADHSTKPGTGGLIHVEQGRLHYVVIDPAKELAGHILTPDTPPGLVEPMILHRVEPLGDVRFHVVFFERLSTADDGGMIGGSLRDYRRRLSWHFLAPSGDEVWYG